MSAPRTDDSPRAVAAAVPDAPHFAAATCHNCGATLLGKHCVACGQKRAARLEWTEVATLAWDKVRLFEFELLTATLALLKSPGRVAREYVLGARKRHVHPLKLLLVGVGLLLLVLAQSRYLDSDSAQVNRAIELARAYGQWSFSLGLVAVLAASTLCFPKRLGYNLTEHLVLAVYTHFLIILASAVNLLPTLLLREPAFLAAHKLHSAWAMNLIEAAIVAVAYTQFFLIDLRREAWRLLFASATFVAIKWALLQGFAWLLVKLVLWRLA